MQVVLIDRFIINADAKDEFLTRMNINRNFIKSLPGFIEDAAYEQADPGDECRYVTVAVWENEAAFQKAKAAVAQEYQKQGFDLQEMLKRLNIQIERAVYKRMNAFS